MTKRLKQPEQKHLTHLVERYLGLESMEVTEELLELCGAHLDARALPFLRQRLKEEGTQIPLLQQRGYIRMREKSEQLVASLEPLIAALSQGGQRTEEGRV
jgi:hypothetical protein